jgi:hypothetical protein
MIDQDQFTLITMTTFSCENMASRSVSRARLQTIAIAVLVWAKD